MGKKINISQPVVINTSVTPLDESFWIAASGLLQQNLNTDTGVYTPNRTNENEVLILSPKVNLFDSESNDIYIFDQGEVSLFSTEWYIVNYNGGNDTKITSVNPSDNYYIVNGFNLAVRHNVSDSINGVTLKCIVKYTDPRDSSISSLPITEFVHLTVNKSGTLLYPTISLNAPSKILYNPFGEKFYSGMNPYSQWNVNYLFNVTASVENIKDENKQYYLRWYCSIDNGTMKEAYLQPCVYSYAQPIVDGGQVKVGSSEASIRLTNRISVDSRYGEITRVKVQLFEFYDNQEIALPVSEQFSITLKIPRIDVLVVSDKGNMVKKKDKDFVFTPIINTNLGLFDATDDRVKENLRFEWFKKKQRTNDAPTNLGFGINKIISSKDLTYKNGSVQVWCDVLFCGTFQKVVYNGQEVCWFESSEDFNIEDMINSYKSQGQNFFYSNYFKKTTNSEEFEVFGKSYEQGEEYVNNGDTIHGLE